MKCQRCDGTMVLKKFHDYGGYDLRWKCLRCGEMRDHGATKNWLEEEGQWERIQEKEVTVAQA